MLYVSISLFDGGVYGIVPCRPAGRAAARPPPPARWPPLFAQIFNNDP